MTRIVNIKSDENYDVFIGRPGRWGNPFRINYKQNRSKVIELYEEYLRNDMTLLALLPTLRGKTLGCYCKPLLCHGDVLIKLLHEIYGE